MTSLVDSKAHFAQRLTEIGMSDGSKRNLLAAGFDTLGKLGFGHGQPGATIDQDNFDRFARATMGAMASIADVALLKRMLFESHTMILSQLKEQATNPEASASRKLPQVEREAKMQALRERLTGVLVEKQLEPAHSLIDLTAQQYETRQLKFISLEKAISREWEIQMGKSAKQIELDVDKLLVKTKDEVPDNHPQGELNIYEAFRRRGLAYVVHDMVSWEVHERYVSHLFSHLRREPPAGYAKCTIQQLLRADRAVWTKMIEDGVSVRRKDDGTLQMDSALPAALQSYEISFHLMPLPKPMKDSKPAAPARHTDWEPNRRQWSPYPSKGKGKGKDKGKKGKSDRFNVLPKALLGRNNVSVDARGRRLCFNFNMSRCEKAAAGAECPHGWHLCTRKDCHAPHAEFEHPKDS